MIIVRTLYCEVNDDGAAANAVAAGTLIVSKIVLPNISDSQLRLIRESSISHRLCDWHTAPCLQEGRVVEPLEGREGHAVGVAHQEGALVGVNGNLVGRRV